jgi:hypothetical protein
VIAQDQISGDRRDRVVARLAELGFEVEILDKADVWPRAL